MNVTAVSERKSDLGEGPHWDPLIQKLYYVDAFVGDVCRLDPATGLTETVHLDGITTFVIPYRTDPSKLLITLTRQIRKLDFNTGESEVLTELTPADGKDRFNDGKCDNRGRLWTGTLVPSEEEKGHLYRLDPNYTLTQVADKVTLSNGLAWSIDNRKFYYVDSEKKIIHSFDYNLEDGTASNQQVLVNYSERDEFKDLGVPDGMTIDIEGKLWVACYGGSCLLRLDPETRTILHKVDFPCKNVTSCCFGGPHLDILYVTTAKRELPEDEKDSEPLAGAVFAVTGHGTRGQPPVLFVE
ncbi:hypothetical protein JTE90_012912 [Oedothorax gibbosus]|uniref:Regucalcin n=1 Tax=Oedothorax gibbosus TaxID=931172 RepID=A0AAV6UF18_9ARAC|nr:hypothetical protein JTE90_012912 [Oedothorax gibbosus]